MSLDPLAQPTLFELEPVQAVSLADRFGVPPFSVLDGRSGPWQERKQAWLSLGIKSEEGRDDKLLDLHPITSAAADGKGCKTCGGTGAKPGTVQRCKDCQGTGKKFANYGRMGATSIFDPVLCELAYRWFSPPGGLVLDPYAGGSVRGLVAAVLGRQYLGVDLRPEQIASNYEQAAEVLPARPEGSWEAPAWIEGDSRDLRQLVGDGTAHQADFIFSCPPYYDLEKYSTDPRDLSNAGEYPKFLSAYRDIIGHAAWLLKPDRFACFVVSEVRASGSKSNGTYVGLVPDTIRAWEDHGLHYYNEFVLVNPVGSAPVRASGYFLKARKAVRVHQNVLVFVKGDPKAAAEQIPLAGAAVSQEAGAEAWADQTELVVE